MASVRKRGAAYEVHFGAGKDRGQETFKNWKDANARRIEIERDLQRGTFKRINRDITFGEAAEAWVEHARARRREPTTLRQYKSHLDHFPAALAKMKLAHVRKGHIAELFDHLLKKGVSDATARKIVTSAKSVLNYAVERDWIAQNDALTLKFEKPDRGEDNAFPEKGDIAAILEHAGRWYAILLTAASTGMRVSELRGLIWRHVDFEANEIHVRQRADYRGEIGPPKSKRGVRSIPMTPDVRKALAEHKLGSKFSRPTDYVFCTRSGTVEQYSSILRRGLWPAQIKAGIVDANGEPKFSLHDLRHFAASWMLEQFQLFKVSRLLGHSSQQLTADRYGHLLKGGNEDHAKFAEAAASFSGR